MTYASARIASMFALHHSSMRRTSGCLMIATGLGSRDATSRNWMRSLAYSTACWYARSAIARPCTPTLKRAAFIITNMYSRPRFASPTR